jgi:hypothetical protein
MSINATYLMKIKDLFITSTEDAKIWNDIIAVYKGEMDEDDYYEKYDIYPEEDVFEYAYDLYAVVEPSTVLDVGQEKRVLKKLNETLIDKFDADDIKMIMNDEAIAVTNDNKYYLEDWFAEHITDWVSDQTGYLVDTLHYHLEYKKSN